MKVNAQIRAFSRAILPCGLNTGNVSAKRAFAPAATRPLVVLSDRNSGSVGRRLATLKFQPPVTMIFAFGEAARSWLRIEVRRDANCAKARGARAWAQAKLPLHASNNSKRSLPKRLSVTGLTWPLMRRYGYHGVSGVGR